ncbi:MAG: type II secretion system F family protein [Nanohaloarchaea archaeon]|nr:type II secretion system F family protein [Candidatus Nanohaloarchaea archaeon]
MLEFFKEEKLQKGRSTEDKIILGSIIAGAFLVFLGIISYISGLQQIGGSILILGLIVSILPYGIISFLKNRAIREVEDQFPSFLKDLAESKRGGMTIIQSFDSAKETDYGRLNKEIEQIHNELTWGVPFPEVMDRFSKRMDESAVIQESISILLQSFKSGGNITKTLESIAEDSAQLKEVIQEKNSKIKQQIFIMYVIYFLFIGITVGIYYMLSQLLGLGNPGQGALQNTEFLGGSGGSPNYCSGGISYAQPMCEMARVFGFVPNTLESFTSQTAQKFKYGAMAYYKSLLFAMLMVQGICTGAVAGQIGEGSPSAGVKHALVMIPIAFLVFMYMVGLSGV